MLPACVFVCNFLFVYFCLHSVYASYTQEHSNCLEAKKAIVSSINAKREVMLAPAFVTKGEYRLHRLCATILQLPFLPFVNLHALTVGRLLF